MKLIPKSSHCSLMIRESSQKGGMALVALGLSSWQVFVVFWLCPWHRAVAGDSDYKLEGTYCMCGLLQYPFLMLHHL